MEEHTGSVELVGGASEHLGVVLTGYAPKVKKWSDGDEGNLPEMSCWRERPTKKIQQRAMKLTGTTHCRKHSVAVREGSI